MTMRDADCIFCAIVADEQPGHIVFADDHVVAFLDIKPLFPGHTLVVPRDHHVTLADLPPDQVPILFDRVQRMSTIIPEVLGAQGTFVAMNNIVSQSVPHLHVHVVPRTKGDGLRGFFWPRTDYDSAEHAADVAARLGAAWDEQT